MIRKIVLLSVIGFMALMSTIGSKITLFNVYYINLTTNLFFLLECCKLWDKPQSRVHQRTTTTETNEAMTTSQETTEKSSEIDFVSVMTTDQDEDNFDERNISFESVRDITNCYGDKQLNCLNGGICVNYTLPTGTVLLSCKCLEGFIGERCAFSGYLLLILHDVY